MVATPQDGDPPAHLHDLEPRLEVVDNLVRARCAKRPYSTAVARRTPRRTASGTAAIAAFAVRSRRASSEWDRPHAAFGEGQLHDPYAVPDIGVDGLVDHPGAAGALEP